MESLEIEISVLRETLEDCVLTIAERVALRVAGRQRRQLDLPQNQRACDKNLVREQ